MTFIPGKESEEIRREPETGVSIYKFRKQGEKAWQDVIAVTVQSALKCYVESILRPQQPCVVEIKERYGVRSECVVNPVTSELAYDYSTICRTAR